MNQKRQWFETEKISSSPYCRKLGCMNKNQKIGFAFLEIGIKLNRSNKISQSILNFILECSECGGIYLLPFT